MSDPVNHPAHYTSHPSGIECIQITEHMCFNLGSAIKYIWRCDLKRDDIEDLKKAEFYIKREIEKRAKEETKIASEILNGQSTQESFDGSKSFHEKFMEAIRKM